MAVATIPMREGAELVGENGQRYLLVQAMGQPNVWIAVDAATQEKLYIVKQPSDDDSSPGWPRFQHEMVMHELFKENASIRPQVDRIPPTSLADPPKLVLELLQTTLWDARRKREFSDVELKEIMRCILLGLQEVHQKGLVYADLKMENILISGFEPKASKDSPAESNQITAKLGDLGIVMSPIKGTVQPIAYRAPEVYFRHEISPAADIWSWGLIYCQLLEAQASFHKTGMYDDLLQGSFIQKEQSVQKAIANDFDLGSLNYYDGCVLPDQDRDREGQHWERLRAKGIPEKELDFLRWVLNPVPTERPTAQEIIDAGWLDPGSEGVGDSAKFVKERTKNVRKRSEPSLFAKFYDKFAKKRRESDDKEPRQTPDKDTKSTPLAVDTQVAAKSREGSLNSRPATPRSSTGKPGGTFLNYGSLMK